MHAPIPAWKLPIKGEFRRAQGFELKDSTGRSLGVSDLQRILILLNTSLEVIEAGEECIAKCHRGLVPIFTKPLPLEFRMEVVCPRGRAEHHDPEIGIVCIVTDYDVCLGRFATELAVGMVARLNA